MISDDRVRNVLHWNEKVFALVPGDPPHARDELLHLVQAIATELMDVRAKLAEALAGTCQQVIPHTFVACGEGENYCSRACRLRAMLAASKAKNHELEDRLRVCQEQNDALGDANELAVKLATVMAAKEEACDYWRIHLDGAVRRAIAGEDGGHRMEYAAIERLRNVGKTSR